MLSNTSGQGKNSSVPNEIHGWNWGAFFFMWIWGFRHRAWISLLCLIPIISLPMSIYLGVRGNVMAWQNCHWESVESFKISQRKWTRWMLVCIFIGIPAVIFALLFAMSRSIENDQARAVQLENLLRQDAQIQNLLGAEIKLERSYDTQERALAQISLASYRFDFVKDGAPGNVQLEGIFEAGVWEFCRAELQLGDDPPLILVGLPRSTKCID